MAGAAVRQGIGRPLATGLVVAVMAMIVAGAVLALTREAGSAPSIWPLNAIVLVVLLRTVRTSWWAILLGMVMGNAAAGLVTGDDLTRAVAFALANGVETLIAATLLTRRFPMRLARREGVVRFVGVTVLACAVSTTLTFMTLSALGSERSLETSGLWFAADWLGLAMFAPLASALADNGFSGVVDRKRVLRTVVIFSALIAVTVAAFWQTRYPLLFLAPVMMALVAFQLGLGGAALASVVVAAIAVPLTFAGRGPIALIRGDATAHVLVLQAFLGSTTLMALVVGAAVLDRRKLVARLTRTTDQVKTRAAHERTLLDQARLAERMSNVGYWTLTPASGEVFWSPEVYRIHGVTPETFDPKLGDALAFYPDEDRVFVEGMIAQGVATGEGWDFDATLLRSDGERREVRSVASCETDGTGKVVKIFGVFKDMTDERQMLKAVAENERKYRMLADNASDMIASFRPDGEITFISPASAAILGYAPDEMLGRNVVEMTHPDDRTGMLDHYKALFAMGPDGVSSPYHFRTRHREGHWIWLEGQPKVFFDKTTGRPVEIQDAARDVTSRKELELALAQAREDAEAATKAKASFLATMSHEIRTPLNGVLGFAELLDGTVLNDDQSLYVRRIRSAGKGLATLIDDILDFSRIEAGKLPIHDNVFDLAALAEEVTALVESGMASKPIRFEVVLSPEIAATVRGDDLRVRQVLLNLLGNAAKFTDEGSIRLEGFVEAGQLKLSVTDTGPGIEAHHMARLFEGFTQVDGSITRRFGGSGLGLSISKSLALLMDGDLVLESEPGVGTTATLSVPYRPATSPVAARSRSGAAADAASSPPLKVMVVDDGPMNRELIEIALKGAGHASVAFADALSAIEALETGAGFDVILMDVQMPGLDGLEATRRIRTLGRGVADLPIVALTANVMPEEIAACRNAGMDDHVAKPVDLQALMSVLERVRLRKAGLSAHGTAVSEAPPTDLNDLTLRYVEHLSTLPVEIDRLSASSAWSETARLAHSVAGTAGSFGFPRLSETAFALEAAAKRGAETPDLATELHDAVTAFKAAILEVGTERKANIDASFD